MNKEDIKVIGMTVAALVAAFTGGRAMHGYFHPNIEDSLKVGDCLGMDVPSWEQDGKLFKIVAYENKFWRLDSAQFGLVTAKHSLDNYWFLYETSEQKMQPFQRIELKQVSCEQ